MVVSEAYCGTYCSLAPILKDSWSSFTLFALCQVWSMITLSHHHIIMVGRMGIGVRDGIHTSLENGAYGYGQ